MSFGTAASSFLYDALARRLARAATSSKLNATDAVLHTVHSSASAAVNPKRRREIFALRRARRKVVMDWGSDVAQGIVYFLLARVGVSSYASVARQRQDSITSARMKRHLAADDAT